MSRVLIVVLALSGAAVPMAQRQPSLLDLIEQYRQGRYDEAVRQAAAIEDLGPLRLRFVQDVPLWIGAEPARAEARRAAAAAFLVEVTHARLESDWGRFIDLIEFVCAGLRTAPPSPFELAWHRASIALASRARARTWLLGEYPLLPHQPPRKRPLPKVEHPSPQHLMHALARFPDDSRLKLAQIVAWTWGRDQEPVRNANQRLVINGAVTRRLPPQREAITAFHPLLDDPHVGDEAAIRTGYVYLSMGEHESALAAFERAQRRDAERSMRYLSYFAAGRAFDALRRPDDAMKQFAAALAVIPEADSASVALASLQFVHDDREHAVTLLNRTFAHRSTAIDPGRLVGYGSFMHWQALQAALRAELPR